MLLDLMHAHSAPRLIVGLEAASNVTPPECLTRPCVRPGQDGAGEPDLMHAATATHHAFILAVAFIDSVYCENEET